MPSLIRTFVRFETMILPSIEFRTSSDIFWPRLEWKLSEEYLVILFRPIGCKKKPWALFLLRSVHLEKQQTRRKSTRFYSWLGIFRDTSLSIHVFVYRHCCPFKCFIELYYFLVLIVCQDLFLTAFPVVILSRTWTSHSGVLKMPRASNEYGWSLEGKCKRKWFWDLFLLVYNRQLVPQVCTQLGKIHKWFWKLYFRSFFKFLLEADYLIACKIS